MKTKLAKRDYLVLSTSEVRFPFVIQAADWETFDWYCDLLNSLVRENVKMTFIDSSGNQVSPMNDLEFKNLLGDKDFYWALFYVGRLGDAMRLLRDGTCQDLR